MKCDEIWVVSNISEEGILEGIKSNRHFLCKILLCTNAVLQNLPLNRDNFLQ